MSDALAPRRELSPGAFDVVGAGQVSLDLVAVADRLPPPGGKAEAKRVERLPGGQVATAMLGCARLGLHVAFVGCIGDDGEGQVALAPLRGADVDVSHVQVRPGVASRTAQIWVDADSGERAILGVRDPALALDPDALCLERVASAGVAHLDTGDPAAGLRLARAARAAGVPVVLDADAPGEGLLELLSEVDFPVVSRPFAETLFGTSRVREALEQLVSRGARMAVVTLGPGGALASLEGREIACPAYRAEARDTTGAGDAFAAGLIFGLRQGLGAEEVLRNAAAAAALNCRALGAQGGLPDREELSEALAADRREPWRDPDA